ncbi:hypothetical protein GF386_00450 [Candidatus Pacearchaeota archaeon]|nr:hypothetical protein [Candidatus Pacearchaeota archaeon]
MEEKELFNTLDKTAKLMDDKKGETYPSRKIENRKKIFKKIFAGWVKDNYDKIFLIILGLAFIIRMVVFFKTLNQPLWFDAAHYLSPAKRLALDLPINDIWYYRRGFLWALIPLIIFKFGLGEAGVRFAEVLFSTGIVFVSYFLIKEMFNKKLALASSIGLTFSWIILFFTGRPLTSIPATFFLLLGLLFFWKGYVKKNGDFYIYLFAIFYTLSILTRMQYVMFAPVFLIFIFTKEKFKFLKDKRLWFAFVIFLLIFTPQVILYSSHYGNPVMDWVSYYAGIEGTSKTGEVGDRPSVFDSSNFDYFFDLPYMLTTPIFVLFIIGVFYFFIDLILGFDSIFKNQDNQKKLFVFLWIFIPFFALGYITPYIEQRYIIPILPFLFVISAIALFQISNFIKNYFKLKEKHILTISFIVLIALLIPNLTWANNLIDAKKNSYLEVKQSGLWIKENSNHEDIIISKSKPQLQYYSERSVYPIALARYAKHTQTKELLKYQEGEAGLDSFIKDYKPRYLMLSVYENHEPWMYSYPQRHNETLIPVQTFGNPKQPSVVIYEFKFD